jgi:hypothetical protein
LAAPISEERARQFAQALVASGGNRTAASALCGFPAGNTGAARAMYMCQHHLVQKHIQIELQNELQRLVPRAIATLEALTASKSSYLRLEASRDILNRNAIGTARERANDQPFVVSIEIGQPQPRDAPEAAILPARSG